MTKVSMTVNGKAVSGEVEGRTLLSAFLREGLALTGTHIGCDTSQCGACVVHVDGLAVKSCTVFALDVAGSTVKTIEGMANPDGSLGVTASSPRVTRIQPSLPMNFTPLAKSPEISMVTPLA